MRDAWEVQLSAVVAGSRRLQAPRKQREQFGPDSPSPICRGPTLGTGEGVNIYIRTKKKGAELVFHVAKQPSLSAIPRDFLKKEISCYLLFVKQLVCQCHLYL